MTEMWLNKLQVEQYNSGEKVIVSTEKLALGNIPVQVKDVQIYNEGQPLLRWARKGDGE